MSLSSSVRISSHKELRGQTGLHPLLEAFVDSDHPETDRDLDRLIYLDLPRRGLAVIEASVSSENIAEFLLATYHPAGRREHLVAIWEVSLNWARKQGAAAVQIYYLKQSGSGDVLEELGFPTTTQIVVLGREGKEDIPREQLPDPSIRRASSEQEWPALVHLLELTLVNSLDVPESIPLRHPDALLRSWGKGHTSEEILILVAESQGQMVGFVVATHDPDGEEDSGFTIHYLGVTEAHRRQGWATRLLEQFFRLAHDVGDGKFAVYVDVRNQPAIQLYQRFGFREFEDLRLPIVFQRLDQAT